MEFHNVENHTQQGVPCSECVQLKNELTELKGKVSMCTEFVSYKIEIGVLKENLSSLNEVK